MVASAPGKDIFRGPARRRLTKTRESIGMLVEKTRFDGLKIITPRRFEDNRGYFVETYKKALLRDLGVDCEFIGDNQSASGAVGTVRGMHYQIAPFAQAKLVRVLRGRIHDVVVDLRPGSSTRGDVFTIELSAENWRQLFIPRGFAHGFCTLEANTEVFYKVDAPYSPDHERGIAWDDPQLGVVWPVEAGDAVLSDRDRKWPTLNEALTQ